MQVSKLSTKPSAFPSSYDMDFYAWTQAQSVHLRQGEWQKLDIPNLVEEIESLGRQQRQELRNRLAILLGHLLKWEYQSEQRSRSWLATIRIQRLEIEDLLEDSPSLSPYLEEAITKAHRKAVQLAVKETNLPPQTFPQENTYSLAQVQSADFYPGIGSDLLED